MGHRNTSREKARRRERHAWAIGIERNPDVLGGAPVFPGTRLSVEHVGHTMLRGSAMAIAELKRDYAYLKPADFEMAKRWYQRLLVQRAKDEKQRIRDGRTYQIKVGYQVPAIALKITSYPDAKSKAYPNGTVALAEPRGQRSTRR